MKPTSHLERSGRPTSAPRKTFVCGLPVLVAMAHAAIAPGAFADLLVVDGDPLKNLGLFKDGGPHLSAIMKAGKFHKNAL